MVAFFITKDLSYQQKNSLTPINAIEYNNGLLCVVVKCASKASTGITRFF